MKEIVRPKRFGDEDVLRLASHLTERDRWIAKDCFGVRVRFDHRLKRAAESAGNRGLIEPTDLKSNRSVQLPGGWMSLDKPGGSPRARSSTTTLDA